MWAKKDSTGKENNIIVKNMFISFWGFTDLGDSGFSLEMEDRVSDSTTTLKLRPKRGQKCSTGMQTVLIVCL